MKETTDATEGTPKDLRRPSMRRAGDVWFGRLTATSAALVLVAMVAMAVVMVLLAWPSIATSGLTFLVNRTWNPVAGDFGALPFIWGTVVTSLLALAMSVPVSLAVAMYLSEFAPRALRTPASVLVELLAAIPSVVYGLWGMFVLVPLLRDHLQPALMASLGQVPGLGALFAGPQQGFGMLAAALILAVMITPTITSVSREVMRAVPAEQREGALALGATEWEAVRFAVLPNARAGILGAVVLGLGRALGETMAVTMVIGNRPDISLSLLSPGYTMASVIANEFQEARGLYLAAIAEVGLVLFAVTVLLNVLARLLVGNAREREP